MNRFSPLAMLIGVFVSCAATATIDWIIEPPNSATVSQPTTGDIEVVFSSETTDSLVILRGSADDDMILNLLNSSASKSLFVEIRHKNESLGETMGSISSMEYGSTNNRPIVIQFLETTGDVHDISASRIVDARIGGDLGSNPSAVILFAHTGGQNASIERMIVGGNLIGDICVFGGGIDLLQVLGDDGIGASSDERLIKTKEAIKHIDVPNGKIYADILVGGYAGGSAPDVGRISAEDGIFGGKEFGGISATKIDDIAGAADPGIFTGGDLVANITLTQALNHEIIVGGSFEDAQIIVPSIAVGGQVVFNNVNGQSGGWGSYIKVNNVTLSPQPAYTQTATSIGGGSVGDARFRLHDSSCVPANGSEVHYAAPPCTVCLPADCDGLEPTDYTLTEVILRHYGPVEFAAAGSPTTYPVKVERAPLSSPTSYSDVSSQFESALLTSGDDAVLRSRIRVKRTDSDGWEPGFRYRLTPRASGTPTGLKYRCVGVTGTPDVASFTYTVDVVFTCDYGLDNFNLNQDNSLTSDDLVVWLANPTDVNHDGQVNASDAIDEATAITQWQYNPYPPQ